MSGRRLCCFRSRRQRHGGKALRRSRHGTLGRFEHNDRSPPLPFARALHAAALAPVQRQRQQRKQLVEQEKKLSQERAIARSHRVRHSHSHRQRLPAQREVCSCRINSNTEEQWRQLTEGKDFPHSSCRPNDVYVSFSPPLFLGMNFSSAALPNAPEKNQDLLRKETRGTSHSLLHFVCTK